MVKASLESWLGRQWLEWVSIRSAGWKPCGQLFKSEAGKDEAVNVGVDDAIIFLGGTTPDLMNGPNHHALAVRQRKLPDL